MRKTSFFLITLIIMVFAFQAGALELGAGLWLPEEFSSLLGIGFRGQLKGAHSSRKPLRDRACSFGERNKSRLQPQLRRSKNHD